MSVRTGTTRRGKSDRGLTKYEPQRHFSYNPRRTIARNAIIVSGRLILYKKNYRIMYSTYWKIVGIRNTDTSNNSDNADNADNAANADGQTIERFKK